MKLLAATTLFAVAVVADNNDNKGPWGWGGNWASCASNCGDVWSSAVDSGFKAFCTNSAALSSATACIGNSNCDASDKSAATSTISSLCSRASDNNWSGPWPTNDAAWSSWASDNSWTTLSDWPKGSPWSGGGPFHGGWGPWGSNGPWTKGGPWTAWWGKDGCPGEDWEGWTSGDWSKVADWTSWSGCTAQTTPTVVTTTGANGSVGVSTTYKIKVAEATAATGASATGGAVQTGKPASMAAGGRTVPVEVGVIGAVFAGFIGVIGVL